MGGLALTFTQFWLGAGGTTAPPCLGGAVVEQALRQMPDSRPTISPAAFRRGEAWGTEFMAVNGMGLAVAGPGGHRAAHGSPAFMIRKVAAWLHGWAASA